MHDILGITPGRSPRFVKNFMAEADDIQGAFRHYHEDVKARRFPSETHCF
jgi:3-methyl-2-oxobutanoate hydroxymethyltransferase